MDVLPEDYRWCRPSSLRGRFRTRRCTVGNCTATCAVTCMVANCIALHVVFHCTCSALQESHHPAHGHRAAQSLPRGALPACGHRYKGVPCPSPLHTATRRGVQAQLRRLAQDNHRPARPASGSTAVRGRTGSVGKLSRESSACRSRRSGPRSRAAGGRSPGR